MCKFVIDELVNILGINDALKFNEITLIAKLYTCIRNMCDSFRMASF